ncbi:hypothetical protein Tco_0563805 [Tanacetum coccineum]
MTKLTPERVSSLIGVINKKQLSQLLKAELCIAPYPGLKTWVKQKNSSHTADASKKVWAFCVDALRRTGKANFVADVALSMKGEV